MIVRGAFRSLSSAIATAGTVRGRAGRPRRSDGGPSPPAAAAAAATGGAASAERRYWQLKLSADSRLPVPR
jgi:hypothetical protein